MRTDYVKREELLHLLAALTPENRLALEISLETGLRISDVLNMRTDAVVNSNDGRMTVRELKTGKSRRVRLPVELRKRAIACAGKVYVFENRLDWRKPRTRQAVYKDLKRVAAVFRLRNPAGTRKLNIAPHTARKTYAVDEYKRDGNLKRVQKLLNHSDEAVTMLYALADCMVDRRAMKKTPPPVKGGEV